MTSPKRSTSSRAAAAAAKKRRGRIVRYAVLVAFVLAVLVPLGIFASAYYSAKVPTPADMKTNQLARIYASDDATEITRVVPPEGNRLEVGIAQIPEHVRNAVLSAEDRNFYSNPGFSITGFARAARDNVMGKDTAGGGSTITQQYVKNVLVGADRTLERKMRELVISTKMARQWSKDEILEAYLNTIYFGRGAYGIGAASQAYFGKPVEELSVSEGAVLAGVIQTPSSLDPEYNLPAIEERWNYVLDGMVEMDVLDPSERSEQVFPPTVPSDTLVLATEATGPEGHIRTQVLRELSAAGISEQDLNTEGLRITTTIDLKAQQAAIDAARSTLSGEPGELRTAVVSVDPRSGAVRAYYGGEDGAGFDFAQAPVQTGSAFKVFGLLAALDDGIGLNARFDSSPLTVGNIRIGNVEGESCGRCTIAEALKRSLNTSFYRLMMSMSNGPQKIADAAHAAGIPLTIPGVEGQTLSENGGPPEGGIVLGQYQARVIDMASAYATIAASGVFHEPYFVQKVVTADGVVLLDRPASPGEQRFDAAVADNATQAMMPIAAYSRGHALAGGRPSASKTGTTQLGDTGLNKDAWMVGYTPSLSTAVWMGTPDAGPITNSWGGSIYGSGLPSDIWKGTMDGALEGTPVESFPWPAPIGGQAGVPKDAGIETTTTAPPPTFQLPDLSNLPPITIPAPPVDLPVQVPSQIEVFPGVTIQIPGL
ncbi:peptidoglycan glycosyltransferase [Rhodococcus rhodochrous J3]|uniref:Penicillin-binding protein n=2 Tax=Rhodococcus rhodochrous TaxID=1829 RepID=A0AA46WVK1_RHORH|nr:MULTISPECIES: transglycosylase domain-containing protein [Rhodococcus]AYA24471.1 penicillin-binding protein [Rhodococcus rhodochrous]MBF4480448.1 penicillin-binding protein [Rhodococcus rhodochrous]MCB8911550.1 penicillin-binding protein [Rhodococcus rhodochrous]MCD2099726.1 penicillin-binding protein [Rhodococcus rhodochrous]MCD2124142.1 penicillin-binding protein [Rhodococcus rhodochrous]